MHAYLYLESDVESEVKGITVFISALLFKTKLFRAALCVFLLGNFSRFKLGLWVGEAYHQEELDSVLGLRH